MPRLTRRCTRLSALWFGWGGTCVVQSRSSPAGFAGWRHQLRGFQGPLSLDYFLIAPALASCMAMSLFFLRITRLRA